MKTLLIIVAMFALLPFAVPAMLGFTLVTAFAVHQFALWLWATAVGYIVYRIYRRFFCQNLHGASSAQRSSSTWG